MSLARREIVTTVARIPDKKGNSNRRITEIVAIVGSVIAKRYGHVSERFVPLVTPKRKRFSRFEVTTNCLESVTCVFVRHI